VYRVDTAYRVDAKYKDDIRKKHDEEMDDTMYRRGRPSQAVTIRL
jgi:hypothetical protein